MSSSIPGIAWVVFTKSWGFGLCSGLSCFLCQRLSDTILPFARSALPFARRRPARFRFRALFFAIRADLPASRSLFSLGSIFSSNPIIFQAIFNSPKILDLGFLFFLREINTGQDVSGLFRDDAQGARMQGVEVLVLNNLFSPKKGNPRCQPWLQTVDRHRSPGCW